MTSRLWARSRLRRGCRVPVLARSGEEFEQNSPENHYPSEEDEPARIGMSEQHVLQIGLSGVGIVANQDYDYHTKHIGHIGRHQSESEEEPHAPGRPLKLREHESYEGRRKDSEGVNPGARRRNDDGHVHTHMLRGKGQAGSRRTRDRMASVLDTADTQKRTRLRCKSEPREKLHRHTAVGEQRPT